ncbi:MAG: universal stress protein, partial [Elainellaceae cyanobacterium]
DLRSRLFGTITDSVFWAAHCPVAVTRLLDEPINLTRILVPVKILTPQTLQVLNFARLFADTNNGSVLVLHVHDPRTPIDQVDTLESAIRQHMTQTDEAIQWDVKMVASDHPAQAILNLSQSFDLVILRSMRRRTAGGLAVSDVTTEVIQDIACSVILFGEPHS